MAGDEGGGVEGFAVEVDGGEAVDVVVYFGGGAGGIAQGVVGVGPSCDVRLEKLFVGYLLTVGTGHGGVVVSMVRVVLGSNLQA